MKLINRFNHIPIIRSLKNRVRPLKHWLFGTNDFYRACEEIIIARGRESIHVIFDVGASTGMMSATCQREFPNAFIYAFEPQPDQRREFHKWVDSKRVCLFDCGLADKPGQSSMRIYSYADASSLLPISKVITAGGISEVGTIEIALRTLDDVIAELGTDHIDFLKIDVEGFEAEVLAGGKRALTITDNAYIEISSLRHAKNTRHHINIFSLMQEAGFTYIECYGDYFFSKDPAVLKRYFT
jgi:FkbM family methyltransferase